MCRRRVSGGNRGKRSIREDKRDRPEKWKVCQHSPSHGEVVVTCPFYRDISTVHRANGEALKYNRG